MGTNKPLALIRETKQSAGGGGGGGWRVSISDKGKVRVRLVLVLSCYRNWGYALMIQLACSIH